MASMTLTTSKKDVKIILTGSGTATINWGDNTSGNFALHANNTICTHSYTSAVVRNITVTGTFINLDCAQNDLTSLTFSACTTLANVWCHTNRLASLNVSACPNLAHLDCRNNALSGAALNSLFTTLPTRATVATAVNLCIIGNSGAIAGSGCNTTAATNKKWRPDVTIVPAATPTFVPVTGITGVPTQAKTHTALSLGGTVAPSNANNKTITWSIANAGTTGATVNSAGVLTAPSAGTVTVCATIVKGASATTNFTKNFTITVPTNRQSMNTKTLGVGVELHLGNNNPLEPTWNVVNAGTTGATITAKPFGNGSCSDLYLVAKSAGTVVVRATKNTPAESRYTEDFSVTITSNFVAVTGLTAGMPTTIKELTRTTLKLSGEAGNLQIVTATPTNATNKLVDTWTIVDGGTTQAIIENLGNQVYLYPKKPGTLKIRATITKGASPTTNFTKDYTITVTGLTDAEKKQQILDKLRIIGNPLVTNNTMFSDAKSSVNLVQGDGFIMTMQHRLKTISPRAKLVIPNDATKSNIYPGALIFVDSAINGEPQLVNIPNRGKIDIYASGSPGGKVNNITPDSGSVSNAVSNIRNTLRNEGHQASRININAESHTSMKSLAFSLGVSASFLGSKTSMNCNTSSSDFSFIHSTKLSQDYFTIELDNKWKRDPLSLFGAGATWDSMEQVIKGKAVAIVTSVTYGRVFSYMRKYSARSSSIGVSAGFSGWGVNVQSSLNSSSHETAESRETFDVGGGTGLLSNILTGNQTQAEIERAMSNNLGYTHGSMGQIVGYEIALITGNNFGQDITPSYSASFYEQECKKYFNRYAIKLRGDSNYQNKDSDTVALICDCKHCKFENGKMVYHKVNSKATILPNIDCEQDTLRHESKGVCDTSLQAPAGVYFEKINLRIRFKYSGNYYQNSGGLIDDTSFNSGRMDVIITDKHDKQRVRISDESPTQVH